MERLHALVHGRVQGVSFRATTQQTAQQLNLTGWVRNRPDGTVEVLAEGPRAALERLLTFAGRGALPQPRLSRSNRAGRLPAANTPTSGSPTDVYFSRAHRLDYPDWRPSGLSGAHRRHAGPELVVCFRFHSGPSYGSPCGARHGRHSGCQRRRAAGRALSAQHRLARPAFH
ncbi:MAG: acylphosphatase [Anaerolineae bacterium]|nr:acylphosphatase [Anaerolineae bacterium]